MRIRELILLIYVALFGLTQAVSAQIPKPYTTLGPYPSPHEGILMGNGNMGVEVFGDSTLNLSVSLAGAWQRNGVPPMDTAITYAKVKALLLAKDEAGLNKLFKRGEGHPKLPVPFQMGGYELRLRFTSPNRVTGSTLDYATGVLHVHTSKGEVRLVMHPIDKIFIVNDSARLLDVDYFKDTLLIAGETCRAAMKERGVPRDFQIGFKKDSLQLSYGVRDSVAGQMAKPTDTYMYQCVRRKSNLIFTAGRGMPSAYRSFSEVLQASTIHWSSFWNSRPRLHVPDSGLQLLYHYCLYKAGTVFHANAPAATLQGPYNESYQLPPWSNDYHFNVNVQMMYGPLAAAGMMRESIALWNMVSTWIPEMRKMGERFYGRKGAMFLPHAVDDQMHPIGTFWTGMIDPGCLAWLACLCFDQHMYQPEPDHLKGLTTDLLKGALEAYRAVLEWKTDSSGKRYLSLPVSVSPEFRGSRMDAWGANPSYQLAAIHGLAQRHARNRKLAGLPADLWSDTIARYLPPYTTLYKERYRDYPGQRNNRIALWDGQDLPESHRHHSHLGAIYPFSTIIPRSTKHLDIVDNSLSHWVYQGMGSWTGWCLPWAAIINLRCGRPDAALAQLHWWMDNFVTASGQTTHDALGAGESGAFVTKQKGTQAPGRMFMQLDASFGFVDAVQQMFAYTQGDTVYFAQGIPSKWRDTQIKNLHLPNGWHTSVSVSSKYHSGNVELWGGGKPIYISLPIRGTDGSQMERPHLFPDPAYKMKSRQGHNQEVHHYLRFPL